METQNNIITTQPNSGNEPNPGKLLAWIQLFSSLIIGLLFLVNVFVRNSDTETRLSKVEAKQEVSDNKYSEALTEIGKELVRLRTILEEGRDTIHKH